MKGAFTILEVAGIRIRVHITFLLVLLVFGYWGGKAHGPPGAAFAVLSVVLLFVCVVLHELGHSLVAKRFGLPVKEIVLLPIGGVSELGRNPEKPIHELLISVAGPLVNVVIAILLLLFTGVGAQLQALEKSGLMKGGQMEPSLPNLLLWLLAANITVAVFNLIPAFPMDGGRVLRAVLSMFLGPSRATLIAGAIGQALALALGFMAIMTGNLLLALVALFVFMGAGQEVAEEQARSVLSTLRVGEAYNKHAITLFPGDHVSKVVDYILTSYQPDFAVLNGRELAGVVTRQDVLKTLASDTRDVYVAGIMSRDVLRVSVNDSVETVRDAMREKETRLAAVHDGDAFLGLVSLEDIAEALLMTTFLRRQKEARERREGDG